MSFEKAKADLEEKGLGDHVIAVSYTHLDVYKRQTGRYCYEVGNFSDRHHCQKVCIYGGTDGRRGGAACCLSLIHIWGEDGKYHFASTSFDANALNADPALGLSYIVAPPRMQRYLDCLLYTSRCV